MPSKSNDDVLGIFAYHNTFSMMNLIAERSRKSKNEKVRKEAEETFIAMLRAYRTIFEDLIPQYESDSESEASDSDDETATATDYSDEESDEGESSNIVNIRTVSEA